MSAVAQTLVFLHVGTRKSGTSYLQLALRKSIDALSDQGVALMFRTRDANVRRQLLPLRELVATGDPSAAEAAMRWTARRIRQRPDDRHLITLEDLAELPEAAIKVMVDGLSEFDVRVIVTARHWGVTIPSEWQQRVKERHTGTYREFVEDIRERRGPEAELFLARQDVPAIVERWAAHAPVTVVAVPPSTRTEGTLVELFSELIGVDPTTVTGPRASINQSLTMAQAEMLRRVNIELGDRLPEPAHSYRVGMREWLTRRSLMRHRGPSIRLPEELLPWCRAVTAQQLEALKATGARIVGDPADLVAGPDLETGSDVVTDGELAAIAITTLADLGADRWREVQERQEQEGRTGDDAPAARKRSAPAEKPAGDEPRGRWRRKRART